MDLFLKSSYFVFVSRKNFDSFGRFVRLVSVENLAAFAVVFITEPTTTNRSLLYAVMKGPVRVALLLLFGCPVS